HLRPHSFPTRRSSDLTVIRQGRGRGHEESGESGRSQQRRLLPGGQTDSGGPRGGPETEPCRRGAGTTAVELGGIGGVLRGDAEQDRKSTRLNSSHVSS